MCELLAINVLLDMLVSPYLQKSTHRIIIKYKEKLHSKLK